MVRIKDILQWIDSWAPFRYAELWDNCGLQVGNPQSAVTRALVALDPASCVIEEAEQCGCQCVVTHHPLLLSPIKFVRTDSWPGSIIGRALLSGISIIAAHTNLDAARLGTNAQLKELLGLSVTGPLDASALFCGQEQYMGMGLVGLLPRETGIESLAATLSGALGGTAVRVTGDLRKKISRVAVCTGSGASLMEKALAAGAEVFITGDFKYHDARFAEENGLGVIDIGHFASEKLVLEPFADFLRSKAKSEAAELEVFVSKSQADPFKLVV
ncbi:putative GTP cyclohydrolase 1 type 2 [Syntrophobacter sp. SbD1]|nr:putative GTP cyclohydrolase 1 type 2 [Syntrophobacter sp. SbD1]